MKGPQLQQESVRLSVVGSSPSNKSRQYLPITVRVRQCEKEGRSTYRIGLGDLISRISVNALLRLNRSVPCFFRTTDYWTVARRAAAWKSSQVTRKDREAALRRE